MPYTYLLIHKPTGKFYYGVRFSKYSTDDDLWKTYFSHSKTIHKMIEEDGKDSFYAEVRRVFSDPKKAIAWEDKVLQKMIHHPMCLNKGYCGFVKDLTAMYGENNPSKRPKVKRKISNSIIRYWSELPVNTKNERVEKRYATAKKNNTFQKHSKYMKSNNPCSNTVWVNDGNIQKRVKLSEIEKGWKRGRLNFKLTRTTRTCIMCGKVGAGPNMARYHFENCKQKRREI